MATTTGTESFNSVGELSARVLIPKSTIQRALCYGTLKPAATGLGGRMIFNSSDLDALRREAVARFAAKSASMTVQFTAKEEAEFNKMRSHEHHRTKFRAGPIFHSRGLFTTRLFGSR